MTWPGTGWRPPPECPGCHRCIRRALARTNGGYCTTCRPRGPSPVQALPPEELLELHEWQQAAHQRGIQQRQEIEQRARRRRERRTP